MKKYILMFAFTAVGYGANAQATEQTGVKGYYPNNAITQQVQQPMVTHEAGVIKVTDYAQNNQSYINNSMNNNRPSDANVGPYTGNGAYVDPTRPGVYTPSSTTPTVNNLYGTYRDGSDLYPINRVILFNENPH